MFISQARQTKPRGFPENLGLGARHNPEAPSPLQLVQVQMPSKVTKTVVTRAVLTRIFTTNQILRVVACCNGKNTAWEFRHLILDPTGSTNVKWWYNYYALYSLGSS